MGLSVPHADLSESFDVARLLGIFRLELPAKFLQARQKLVIRAEKIVNRSVQVVVGDLGLLFQVGNSEAQFPREIIHLFARSVSPQAKITSRQTDAYSC